jgi:cobalt-zinc-cadmium efflux system membrane fusion protein
VDIRRAADGDYPCIDAQAKELRNTKIRKATNEKTPDTTLLLLALCLGASIPTLVWAHGDEDHGDEEHSATPAMTSPDVAPAETTSTTTVGNIRITVVARTTPLTVPMLAPGEVALPAQTAELLGITSQPVEVAQLATGITFSGQIAPDPNSIVRVASVVPGRITRLAVAQGDTVRQGQMVAVVESRAIGEAQSAYQQALARLRNAQSNFNVVQQQARAGVFSRAPLDTARQAQAEAAGDVRAQQAAVRQAQVALDNVTRLARVGGFANPAFETARNTEAQSREALRTAQAGLTNAQAEIKAAQAELARRRQLAASGSYQSRPVEEARRALVAAQSGRAAATSEVSNTRANLNRAKTLAAEGLISQRDLEAAEQAYETATARLETAQADERAAQQELARQQQVAGSNVNNIAEVGQAQSTLAGAQAAVRTREAEVQRARSQLQTSSLALSRERAIFRQNIANRREISTARANLQAAQAGLYKAQRGLEVANSALQREQLIFRRNLNNTAQVQQARAGLVQAQADLRAAQSTLSLLKSAPGEGVSVPIRAPIPGVVETRDAAVGELIQADAPLLTIVNLNTVALEAALFEADFSRVRIGSPVTVRTEAIPNRTFSGRISFLGSQVDPQTRTLTARAIVNNPGNLRPGMFARGQIQTGIGAASITVPAAAVLDDGAAKIVFLDKGGKYERREVTVGNASNGQVEIKSGVKPGEEVVIKGAPALRAQAAKGS